MSSMPRAIGQVAWMACKVSVVTLVNAVIRDHRDRAVKRVLEVIAVTAAMLVPADLVAVI